MATKAKTTVTPVAPVAPAVPVVATYVVQHTPLLHDRELYQPGDAVELTEAQAQKQGANVAPVPTESEKE